MDATCTIQDSIHVFNLVHKYVSRILGTYQIPGDIFVTKIKQTKERNERQTKKGEYAYAGTDKKSLVHPTADY